MLGNTFVVGKGSTPPFEEIQPQVQLLLFLLFTVGEHLILYVSFIFMV